MLETSFVSVTIPVWNHGCSRHHHLVTVQLLIKVIWILHWTGMNLMKNHHPRIPQVSMVAFMSSILPRDTILLLYLEDVVGNFSLSKYPSLNGSMNHRGSANYSVCVPPLYF